MLFICLSHFSQCLSVYVLKRNASFFPILITSLEIRKLVVVQNGTTTSLITLQNISLFPHDFDDAHLLLVEAISIYYIQ